LNEPAGLEQILLRDVMEHTGSTAVEKPLVPEVSQRAEILEGTGIETAPPLKGYVKFIAQAGGGDDFVDRQERSVVVAMAVWVGKVGCVCVGCEGAWAADWITWKGYDKFWTNLCRDLLPHAQAGEASVDFR